MTLAAYGRNARRQAKKARKAAQSATQGQVAPQATGTPEKPDNAPTEQEDGS